MKARESRINNPNEDNLETYLTFLLLICYDVSTGHSVDFKCEAWEFLNGLAFEHLSTPFQP